MLFVIMAASAQGQEQTPDVTNQYGVRLFLHHNIKNSLTGFGYLEYAINPESDYRRYPPGWPGGVSRVLVRHGDIAWTDRLKRLQHGLCMRTIHAAVRRHDG